MTHVLVEIGFGVDPFDSATLDVSTNWTDVTDDVRQIDYRTATRSDRFSVFSAGNAQIALANEARMYDPAYAAGAHYGDFKRSTPVRVVGRHTEGTATFVDASDLWVQVGHELVVGDRVRFTTSGTTHPQTYAADIDYYVISVATNLVALSATLGGPALAGNGFDSDGTWTMHHMATQWYGYARSWVPEYTMPSDSVTMLAAVDGLGLLAQYDLEPVTETHTGDEVGQRIGRVLDDFGWPSSYRSIGVSSATLAATTFGINALAHCQKAAAADGGDFYAQRDGKLTFDGQSAGQETRQKTAQDVIGHNAAPTPLSDGSFKVAGIGRTFRDKVTIGRSGGTAQTVDNSAANVGAVTLQRTSELMQSDAQALGLAGFFADLLGTEVPHPISARLIVDTESEEVNTILLKRKLRDRITAEIAPPGGGADISADVFMDGIAGTVNGGVWRVAYILSSADAYDDNLASAPATWLILDDATLGELEAYTLGY